MTKQDQDALRKLAERATDGPWWQCGPLSDEESGKAGGVDATVEWIGDCVSEYDEPDRVVVCECGPWDWAMSERNAAYIAACNPVAIRSLLAHLAEAEHELRNANRDQLSEYWHGVRVGQEAERERRRWWKRLPFWPKQEAADE